MNRPGEETHFGDEPFPRKPLVGALTFVLLTLAIVTAVRVTKLGQGDVADAGITTVAERDLRFEDRADGSIAVIDAADNQLVDTLAPGSNNFVRGTLRGLVRERRRESIGAEQAFKLTARSDGHVVLTDPATSRSIDLGSFGPTNLQAFSRLLSAPAKTLAQTASAASTHP